MDQDLRSAIAELSGMAQYYENRGMKDKAAQLSDLIDRMGHRLQRTQNVIQLSNYQSPEEEQAEA